MKKLRLFTFALSLILMFGTLFVIPASANRDFYVAGEDFPLEIEKEILTLDLTETPDNSSTDKYLSSAGKVTTEYHLYNPSDSPVTVTLLYSLGEEINYTVQHDKNGVSLSRRILEKYNFTLGGKPIKTTIRHSLSAGYSITKQGNTICYSVSDEYQSYNTYAPDTPVTICTYTVTGLNEKEYPDAIAAMDIPKKGIQNGNALLFVPNHGPIKKTEDGLSRIFVGANEGKSFTVCLINTESNELPEWHLYASNDMENVLPIEGQVTMTKSEVRTFLDYALAKWTPESGISRVDWYNAFALQFYKYRGSNDHLIKHDLTNSLYRIYEYEITLGAGERTVHTVTAPIFPRTNKKLTPVIYTYSYALSSHSPQKAKEAEIYINTPLTLVQKEFSWLIVNYSTYSDLSNRLEKTEQGYYLHLDALPEYGDLTFTLSESADPERKTNHAGWLAFLLGAVWMLIMWRIVLPIALVITIVFAIAKIPDMVRRRREKRNAQQKKSQNDEAEEEQDSGELEQGSEQGPEQGSEQCPEQSTNEDP